MERRMRLEAETELEETKQSLREVRLRMLPSVDGLDLDEVIWKYDVVIVERGLNNPFQLNSDLIRTAREVTAEAEDEIDKARLLFYWMWKNILYDFEKLEAMEEEKSDSYRDSIEVLEHQRGVCGEQTILYVAMARTIGLTANYVSVTVDDKGESVCHACAGVFVSGRTILVDPAYRTFDIQHQKYEVLNDEEAAYLFKFWDTENGNQQ